MNIYSLFKHILIDIIDIFCLAEKLFDLNTYEFLKKKLIMDNFSKLSFYDYHLPQNLIAERPTTERHNSRLLVYDQRNDSVTHTSFFEITKFLSPKMLLVLNNTRVLKARLVGNKYSKGVFGGKCELLIVDPPSLHSQENKNIFKVLIKCRGVKKIGDEYLLADQKYIAKIIHILNDNDNDSGSSGLFDVEFYEYKSMLIQNYLQVQDMLNDYGLVPIPKYIRKGESDFQDSQDYQTVFSSTEKKNLCSIAAPTAGLHFSEKILNTITRSNIELAHVTLHVGIATFLPVRTENILDHKMHKEKFFIAEDSLKKIEKYNENIVAVGTTSLRVLESKIRNECFKANTFYDTDIFIYPGKEITTIKGLITNFHLPKSTLIMLVSALIGREKTLEIYAEAIKEKYRFFSYGDAMLVIRKNFPLD
ncbi:MAG: tRNA preQ1(34) S-adenosylmethionine ribosyltransferase-isomerase QueA [Oligoflexia bacterium]|nr:tRNA preQ1(34) S-adenosylmethionine ribosyltransferase-isomerase QueA [Oligoflexia bacterium]